MDTFDRNKVIAAAAGSALASVLFRGRGKAPIGYVKGMALAYARAYQHFKAGDSVALATARPVGALDRDALAWFDLEDSAPLDRLRSVYALLVGLGMRESGGNFGEGRDQSASNTTADTAEAGLFQMSYDITKAVPAIREIMKVYANAADADGLGEVFHEGVRVSPRQLQNYGTGAGADYQRLAKAMPAFAVEAAALGVRTLRKHWGPLNRKEAEVRPEAVILFRVVEAIVDATPAGVTATSNSPSFVDFLRKVFKGRGG
jgi:hypothetical protein